MRVGFGKSGGLIDIIKKHIILALEKMGISHHETVKKSNMKVSKKLLGILVVAVAMTACNNSSESAANSVDSAAKAAADTVKAAADTAIKRMDSAATAVMDSAKSKMSAAADSVKSAIKK
jgi:hypothetical protein